METKPETETLDSYIRKVENQEIKGLLLKLKNEMRKTDVTWETVKGVLLSIEQKDVNSARDIFSLIIRDAE
jgi:hypothetical protein